MSNDVSRNYPFNDIVDRVFSESTPTQPDHRSQSMVPTINEGVGIYDSIDDQQKTGTSQARPANPSSVREASRRGNDFYDAEEHTYAVVNKKRLEDGEGEGGDLGRVKP